MSAESELIFCIFLCMSIRQLDNFCAFCLWSLMKHIDLSMDSSSFVSFLKCCYGMCLCSCFIGHYVWNCSFKVMYVSLYFIAKYVFLNLAHWCRISYHKITVLMDVWNDVISISFWVLIYLFCLGPWCLLVLVFHRTRNHMLARSVSK